MAVIRYIDLDPDGKTIHGWGTCDETHIVAQSPGVTGGTIQVIPDDTPILDGKQEWNGTAVITPAPTLDALKAAKIADLKNACDMTIAAGFTSQALGGWNFYGSNDTDQLNMQRVAIGGGQLMCSASSDDTTWALNYHTAAQGVTVLADFGTMTDTARGRLASKTTAVNACTTADQVAAVTW